MKNTLDFKKDDSVLIIVDMQNAFIDKNGSLPKMGLDASRVLNVIDPIKRLKTVFVTNKLPVIYIQHVHRKDGFDMGLIEKVFPPIFKLGHCIEETWDCEIIEELKPEPNDIVVKKFRFSGFYKTPLENILKSLGKETLVICGIATNICVESTVRDAFYRDYNVFVPQETTASYFESAEIAALENFRFAFARVLTIEELIEKVNA